MEILTCQFDKIFIVYVTSCNLNYKYLFTSTLNIIVKIFKSSNFDFITITITFYQS